MKKLFSSWKGQVAMLACGTLAVVILFVLGRAPGAQSPALLATQRNSPASSGARQLSGEEAEEAIRELMQAKANYLLLETELPPKISHARCLLVKKSSGQKYWKARGAFLDDGKIKITVITASWIQLSIHSEQVLIRQTQRKPGDLAPAKKSRVKPLASQAKLRSSRTLRRRIAEIRGSQWEQVAEKGLQLVSPGKGRLGQILQQGDLVTQVNGEQALAVSDLVMAGESTGVLMLRVRRGGREFGLSIRLLPKGHK